MSQSETEGTEKSESDSDIVREAVKKWYFLGMTPKPVDPPPPCFRIGGAEDNFIFDIEYCFFFVPVLKLR